MTGHPTTTIALSLILGLIPAVIAKEKGRNFWLWWFYGFMLFIVAIIHSIVIPTQKRCMFCGKSIHIGYTVCPFCGKMQIYRRD